MHPVHNIALVTPLKNELSGIDEIWCSTVGQSVRPSEWIIVDNGSTDGTYEWLCSRASTSPFHVVVLSFPGATIAQMMNRAIERSTCSIIACCHGGTSMPSNWLEALTRPFTGDQADAVFGTWRAVGSGMVERRIAELTQHPLAQYDENKYLAASRSLAFKREVWKQVGGFPEWLPKFGEDTLYAIRLRASGCRVVVAPAAEVGWKPQSTWKRFIRQQYLYSEGDGVMRLPAMDRVRSGIRCGLVLFLVAAACVCWGFYWGAATLFALIVIDYIRANMRGARHLLGSYVLWFWILPLCKLIGYVRGRYLSLSGRVQVPLSDRQAIRAYYRNWSAS